MEENEFHQRQPLLAGDPDDLEEHNLTSLSPRVRYVHNFTIIKTI